MTIPFETLRDWAIERATHWALTPDGDDRLAVRELRPAWAIRIEAFNLLMPLGGSALGRSTDFGTTGIRGALKERGLDRGVRSLMLRARDTIRRAESPTPVAVAFLSELATPSALEPMLAVAAALPAGAYRAIVADPRAGAAWRRAGHEPTPMLGPLREERRAYARTAPAIERRWADLLVTPPSFDLDGHDLRGPALDRLEPLVRRSVPWLAVEQLALGRRLDALGPRWLVLASDQHRVGRLAVQAAAARGIRTLVLQHGLPQYDLGYVPVAADAVATWSAETDAWFTTRGTDPARLVRLGNPRLDALRAIDRDATRAEVEADIGGGDPRLLLALSPNEPERNLTLVRLALAWAEREPGGRLVIKLHPGDGRWDDVRATVREHAAAARVTIAHREPLYPYLSWADLVTLHRSTVAVEALAAGTPVAALATPDASPTDALPDALDLPIVSDVEALVRLVRDVHDPARRIAFVEARREAVVASTGPLDGRSAARIADHLLAA